MLNLESRDHLLFLGSPWITDIADLKNLGLKSMISLYMTLFPIICFCYRLKILPLLMLKN